MDEVLVGAREVAAGEPDLMDPDTGDDDTTPVYTGLPPVIEITGDPEEDFLTPTYNGLPPVIPRIPFSAPAPGVAETSSPRDRGFRTIDQTTPNPTPTPTPAFLLTKKPGDK